MPAKVSSIETLVTNENMVPVNTLDSYYLVKAAPSAFAGGTTNARGDYDGTSGSLTLFTVTGDVLVKVWGVCTVDLAGATGTVEVGTTLNTAGIIAQTTGTDIDAGEVWTAATPASSAVDVSGVKSFILGNGAAIKEKTGTANITAGQIYYICMWRPLSNGSSVVSAV